MHVTFTFVFCEKKHVLGIHVVGDVPLLIQLVCMVQAPHVHDLTPKLVANRLQNLTNFLVHGWSSHSHVTCRSIVAIDFEHYSVWARFHTSWFQAPLQVHVCILYIAMEMWDSRVNSLSQICRAELANSFPSNLLNFKKPVSQHGNGKVNLV